MLDLQPGDILLWRVGPEAPLLGRLIGWAEKHLGEQSGDYAYYHVAFVGPGGNKLYQSKPPSICNSDLYLPLPSYVEAYRLKEDPTEAQLLKLFTYANSQLGKCYNFLGVMTGGYLQFGSFAFCSQFTWECFTHAGILLCPWQMLESPDDIAASDMLVRIQ